MRATVIVLRLIHPRMVGLLRRALLVTGLLFGFLLAGSALAHAETKPPHPVPVHGIGHVRVPDVPPLAGTITSVEHTITSVTKTVTPVTKVVTSLTTTVVRTITPIVRPAMTGPVLTPVLTPLFSPSPGRSRPPATTQSVTSDLDPVTGAPVAPPVPGQLAAVPTTSISVVPPQVLPVDVQFVPLASSSTKLRPAPSPRVPLGGDGNSPIVDVTGGNSTCGASPNGPMFGVSRSFSGLSAARLAGTGIWPGTGPPKWWFFDPRHHPS